MRSRYQPGRPNEEYEALWAQSRAPSRQGYPAGLSPTRTPISSNNSDNTVLCGSPGARQTRSTSAPTGATAPELRQEPRRHPGSTSTVGDPCRWRGRGGGPVLPTLIATPRPGSCGRIPSGTKSTSPNGDVEQQHELIGVSTDLRHWPERADEHGFCSDSSRHLARFVNLASPNSRTWPGTTDWCQRRAEQGRRPR